MIELNVKKVAELGLHQAEVTLTLPPLTIVRHKADRDDLEYEIRNAFECLVGEIVSKQLKNEL